MPYQYLDDIATADIAFRAWGRTIEETFVSAAEATMSVMADDLDRILPKVQRSSRVVNSDLELLLVQFLQELVYYKDAEKLLLRPQRLRLEERSEGYILTADLAGEVIDPGRHKLKVDIKAITLHRLKVGQTAAGWEATVVVDI